MSMLVATRETFTLPTAGSSLREVEDELCRTLAASWTRIMDFFRHCDSNNDGEVSRDEFIIGVISLKLSNDKELVTSLFNSLDVDCSGTLSFGELHTRLRKRAKPKADYEPNRNMRCLMLPTIMPKLQPERRRVANIERHGGDELLAGSSAVSFALPTVVQVPMRRAIAAPRLRLGEGAAAPAFAAVSSSSTSTPVLGSLAKPVCVASPKAVKTVEAPMQVPLSAAAAIAEVDAAAMAVVSVQPAQGEIAMSGERKRNIESPNANAASARSKPNRAPPRPSLLPRIVVPRTASSSAGSCNDAPASTAVGHGLPRYPMARKLRPVHDESHHASAYHDGASIVPSDAVDPQSYVGAVNLFFARKTTEEINHFEASAATQAAGVQDEAAWCDRPLLLALPGGVATAESKSRGLSRRVQQHRQNKVQQWRRQRSAAALPQPSCWEVTFSN